MLWNVNHEIKNNANNNILFSYLKETVYFIKRNISKYGNQILMTNKYLYKFRNNLHHQYYFVSVQPSLDITKLINQMH